MTPIESLMEKLRKALVAPDVSVFFNDLLQSSPRGWPQDNHSMDQLLTTREDSILVQGYSEPEDYKKELDASVNALILLVRKTITALKTPKAIKLVNGIAKEVGSWIAAMNKGKDQSIIAISSQSAEVDRILEAGMADPT